MKTIHKTFSISKWKQALSNAGALLGITCALFVTSNVAVAQKVKRLGTVSEFKQTLTEGDLDQTLRKASGKSFKLATSGASLTTKVNVHTVKEGKEHFVGGVDGSPGSTVILDFANGKVTGKAILLKEKKAYEYTTNAQGLVEVKQVDINKLVCVDYHDEAQPSNTNARLASTPATAPPAGSDVYNLQSLPGCNNVLMLDFDGEYSVSDWNGGEPIDALAPEMTEAEIYEVWKLISEDFRAFNINVTTNEFVFVLAPRYHRVKCIFTPTNTAYPGVAGVAFGNSFYSNDNNPCWVFSTGVTGAGEVGSHELGHTLGLAHDGRTAPLEEYYEGNADWAPIMGVAYNAKLGHWSKGEYANASNTQDDINIIANTANPFTSSIIGFRADEAGNTTANAKLLTYNGAGDIDSLQNVGIITNRNDVDVYYFNSTGGTAGINVVSTVPYANLDIQLTLKNSSGTTLATSNPATDFNAGIKIVLPAGKYYLLIDGVGSGDPVTSGYSDYSSIGQYRIKGNIIANTAPTVSLTANTPNGGGFYQNQLYVKPSTVFQLSASPEDVEGPIAKVEFYQGNVKIGEDAFYPGHTWNLSLAVGTYKFKAKAFDQAGLNTWSNELTVVVEGNPPLSSIYAPTNNANFTAPASFSVAASAYDSENNIKKVDFYRNNVLVGTDDSAPGYIYAVSNLPAGTYVFTSKAYDYAGNVTTSNVTVNVLLVNEAVPAATQFVVRNAWQDQNLGSGVSNASNALKVVHRAYGNSDLWVLETGKTFSVTSGQVYNVKFDFQDFASKPVSNIQVAFATGLNISGTGANLSGSPVTFPAGYSATSFTTKSVNLTAATTGTVFLAIRLNWGNQPSVQITDYIKNIKVSLGAGTQSRSVEEEETALGAGLMVSPNPTESVFNTVVQRDIATIQVMDLQGRAVYTQQNLLKDAVLSFGTEFNEGIYIVNVKYEDGNHESFKIVKTK